MPHPRQAVQSSIRRMAALRLGFLKKLCVYLGEGVGVHFTFFKLRNGLPHFLRSVREGNLIGPWRMEGEALWSRLSPPPPPRPPTVGRAQLDSP